MDCPACKARGGVAMAGREIPCQVCKGSGRLLAIDLVPGAALPVPCPPCNGSGTEQREVPDGS